MSYSHQMLEDIKVIEINILKHFVSCCKELHLSYYMMDGSLLGTVRHNGFIPWDDDIDVGMMREDYEVFISRAQSLLPEYLFLQTCSTEKEAIMNFAKIRDTRTTFIETSQKTRKINHGIYIDIFPIDGFPENKKAQNYFKRMNRILSIRIRREYTLPSALKGNKYIEGLKTLFGDVTKIKYPTAISAINARDQLFKKYEKSDFVCNYCGAYGYKAVMPRDWFGTGIQASFEGVTVNIPDKSDLYLKKIYGDYMKYPPKEERIPHHYAEVIDTNKPYSCYLSNID